MNKPRYSEEKEFETLRNELLQGKKYVFERPILIITGSIAFIQFIDKQYAVYFPMIIIGLLFFNLWFTINRMGSIARIVAYIQIVLEDNSKKWYGWETSLRNYRKWLRLHKDKRQNIVIDKSRIFDSLGYFPTIYYMHIIMNCAITTIMSIYSINNFSQDNLILLCLTQGELILFLIYAINKRPAKVKTQIENNRQVWIEVFNDWDNLNK